MAKKASVAILLPAVLAGGMLAPTRSAAGAQTGVIEGIVTLEPPPPPRRTANRYAGGSTATHEIQRLPAVVFLRGSIVGAPPEAEGRAVSMEQRDTAFVPAAVAVQVGGTVDFPNFDSFFHNVFSYSNAERFDLGRYPQGESKSVTFDEPGFVNVFCEVHDFMRAAIVVTDNAFHAVIREDGTFRIEGVPEGEHTLAIWHADHETVERSVTVTRGGIFHIEVELRR